ncbi:MAG TPA: hypothetical protein VGI93_13885 [Steroidobacteraceae bacterium]|jgi:hypothetical protein
MSANSKLKLDPLAASFLDEDIAIAKADLDEIAKQIEKLQAKRRAIEWKIQTLGGGSDSGPDKTQPNGTGAAHGAFHNGFRDTIRKVLREAGKGLKTAEVSDLILKSGFQYTAKTNLNVRVNSDLRRLVKSGVVSCRRGLYSINQDKPVVDQMQ